MTKLRQPLLSLGAVGRLGKILAFKRSRRQNIVETSPDPPDAQSLAQLSWRHMYLKAVALWHALSPAEQQKWESQARRKHMTGFAWFMSQALKPNPGLYLPLQGGTMAGDIDIDGHSILNLPNITRELFIPAGECHSDGTFKNINYYALWELADFAIKSIYMTIKVPDDFVSFSSFKALWYSSAAAGNMRWRFVAMYATAGEDFTTHQEMPGIGVTPTGGASIFNLQEPENPLSLAAIQKADYLGVQFYRDGAAAQDTLTAAARVFGFLFTYMAKQ